MKKYCKKLREWVMKIVNYELMVRKNIMKNKTNVFYVIKDFVMIKKMKIIKIFKMFMIVVIILENIEVRHIIFVICNIKPLKKFL